MVEGRLENEEGGANENTHKNKQKALFFEKITDGSGEGFGVFQGFRRVK